MNRKKLLSAFCLLFLVITLLNGQQRVIDQLLPRLDTLPDNAEKIDVLTALIRAYSYTGEEKEEEKYLQALSEVATRLDDPLGKGLWHIFKSTHEFNLGQVDESFESMYQAMEFTPKVQSKDFNLLCTYNLAELYAYAKNDAHSCIKIINETLTEIDIDQTISPKTLGNTYRALGISYGWVGDTTAAMKAFEQALIYFQSHAKQPFIEPRTGKASAQLIDGSVMNTAQTYEDIAEIKLAIGQNSLAQTYLLQAYDIYEVWEAPFFMGGTAIALSNAFQLEGNLVAALEYAKKAKLLAEEKKSSKFIGEANFQLALLYKTLGDVNAAESLFLDCIAAYRALNDSLELQTVLSALGNLYLQNNNLDQAEHYLNEGMQIVEQLKDTFTISQYAGYLGEVALNKQQFERAEDFLKKAILTGQQYNKSEETSRHLSQLTELYLQKNELATALQYGNLALEAAQNNKNLIQVKASYLLLSKVAASAKDYQQALAYHQQFHATQQQIYTDNAQQLAKAEQTRQQVSLYKEKTAVAEANAQLLAQRNQLFFALGTTFLLLFLASGFLGIRLMRSKKDIEQKNQQLSILNETKDKFFSIIAHDIRSPMVALQSVGKQMSFFLQHQRLDKVTQLADLVTQTTNRLDNLLNNLLNWALSQQGLLPYHPEAIQLQPILQNVSFLFAGAAEAKSLQLSTKIDSPKALFADPNAVQTILRNLISNAIKFTPPGGKVAIESQLKPEEVLILVRNTGEQIPAARLSNLFTLNRKNTTGTAGEKGTGLGLLLCKELVELNQGAIQIENESMGVKVAFTLPLFQNEEEG